MDISVKSVRFNDESMWIRLSDGRTIGVPYAWFPRLLKATPRQREAVEIGRFGLHWEEIHEDSAVQHLLGGTKERKPSGSGWFSLTAGIAFCIGGFFLFWPPMDQGRAIYALIAWLILSGAISIAWGVNRIWFPHRVIVGQDTINMITAMLAVTFTIAAIVFQR